MPSFSLLITRVGHIEWHLEVGLAIQLVEAPLEAQQRNTVPQLMYDNCKALNLPFSGNAAGFASTTQLDGLPLGPYPQNNGWHARGIGAMFGCARINVLIYHFAHDDSFRSCVFTATLGMASVVWYALGGHLSEEEEEHEVRRQLDAKERRRGRILGIFARRS